MLDIKPEIWKAVSVKQGATYYFVYTQFGSEPHYFVVMNRNDNGVLVFLVNTTTNVKGREKRLKMCGFPKETIVYIPKGKVKFLLRDCCIDCNSVLKESKDNFLQLIKGKNYQELPKEFIKLISLGIRKSPEVEPRIKKAV